MNNADLRALVEKYLPTGGSLSFSTFVIPRRARGYDVGSGWVPLRCKPDDIRCGVLVYDEGTCIVAWGIEVDGSLPSLEIEENVANALTMGIDNTLAHLAGTTEPHGRLVPSLTDQEMLAMVAAGSGDERKSK